MRSGRKTAPAQFAGKPILLCGLLNCQHCGCMVTGDIQQEKYTYYSRSNSKHICKKIWVRAEQILKVLLEGFEKIVLPDAMIEKIVAYLQKTYIHRTDA